jgi:hypothetical protein
MNYVTLNVAISQSTSKIEETVKIDEAAFTNDTFMNYALNVALDAIETERILKSSNRRAFKLNKEFTFEMSYQYEGHEPQLIKAFSRKLSVKNDNVARLSEIMPNLIKRFVTPKTMNAYERQLLLA